MIAEDSGLLRAMLMDLFTRHGIQVTGDAETKDGILTLIDLAPPDVAVLDIRLPPSHSDEGLQAAEAIRERHPDVGLLVLSHYAETSYAIRLLQNGSRGLGYLVKDRVQDTVGLIDAIRRVARGEVVIDPEVVQRVMYRRRTADPLERLTRAERTVLELMAEGLSNSAIAARLHYAEKTIEKRVTAINTKLGLPHSESNGRTDVNVRVLAVLTYLRRIGTGL
ncbi:response regulator transcription factor [Actinoplanes subtropicus]|uniref:response regulator transcription factor n=1 Tax=Actinoplanes subtropicus TaxID=543632 RepID=UPI001FDEC2BC|nr:response regulator transcription factor [Actinoplanes subtropicus]